MGVGSLWGVPPSVAIVNATYKWTRYKSHRILGYFTKIVRHSLSCCRLLAAGRFVKKTLLNFKVH